MLGRELIEGPLCGSVGALKPAVLVDGGYLLNGEWRWISGVNRTDGVRLDITHETSRCNGFGVTSKR